MKDKKLQTIPISFEKAEEVDNRFLKVKIYLMHTKENLNGSYFEKSVVEDAFSTLYNTPILGFIPITDDNKKDFEGHKHILVVKDGQYELRYAGQAFGVIGFDCNPRWEMRQCDDGTEREFLVVDGVIWKKFDDATEIFNRDEIKQQSMELDNSFEGFMGQDNFFHFTRISFYGACCLGDSKHPAMINSTIEKVFSFDDLRQEFQQEMELLKSTLGGNTNIEFAKNKDIGTDDKINIDNSKVSIENFEQGGNDMDEKLKLFEIEKYSTIKEVNIKELKDNIDKYSLEELQSKLDFALSSQIRSELSNALRAEKIQDSYGYEYSRYWYVDSDLENNVVYAEDSKDNYNVYKLNYSMNGDNVVIDFESGVKQKIQFADWDQGSVEFSFVPKERFEQIVEKLNEQKSAFENLQKEYASSDTSDIETIMNDMMDEMSSNMSDEMIAAMNKSVNKMKKSLKKSMKANGMMSLEDSEEYKDLQSKFSILETEKLEIQSKFETILNEKSTLETKVSEFEVKLTELKTFQETTLTNQRTEAENEVFEMFSEKLTEEELKPFKETAKDFTIETLKEKLFAIVGQKTTKFESTQVKKPKVNIVLDRNNIEIKTSKPYSDILEQYVTKE